MQSIELINLSQKIILYFLKKNIRDKTLINEITKFLKTFPISQDEETDIFLDQQNAVAEVATSRDGVETLLLRTTATVSIPDILAVIHEYAHGLSSGFSVSGHKIGKLKINTIFEEAMAVSFSEACLNEWIKDSNEFETKNGVMESLEVYPEERNILNTLFFALNDESLSKNLMLEYVLGDKQHFYNVLNGRLGQNFAYSFSIIENEIIKRNKMPTGFGFRNISDIIEINDLVSVYLSNLISDKMILNVSLDNNDFTDSKNRYFKTSTIIQKRALIMQLKNNSNLSAFDIEELLLYDHFESLDLNILLNDSLRIKEWTNETGYTVSDLVQYGAKPRYIEVLLYKFDGQTGERIDRKSKAEEFIKLSGQNVIDLTEGEDKRSV